jgi:hypothetical protein
MAASAGVWVACFADLPAPASCPPDAQHQAGDCAAALAAQAHSGTLDTPILECLSGSRDGGSCSCAGVSIECPNAASACWPPGDCPPAVTAQIAGASCSSIGQGNVLPGCGCIECATACDGVGPVFGAVIPPTPDGGSMTVPIAGFALPRLPDSGAAGVYVRARGTAGPSSGLRLTFFDASSNGPGSATPVDLPSDLSFGETMLLTSWVTPSDAPQQVAIVLTASPGPPERAVVEVDCIVPFVVTR